MQKQIKAPELITRIGAEAYSKWYFKTPYIHGNDPSSSCHNKRGAVISFKRGFRTRQEVVMASTSIDTFEVQLEELKRVFYPGDSVCGRVILKLREDLKIKEMRLECRGEAYVNWPEYSGSHTRYHYNKERYFNAMAVVFGGGKEIEISQCSEVFTINKLQRVGNLKSHN